MSRAFSTGSEVPPARSRHRGRAPFAASFEGLEQRVMLDAGSTALPADLVVGRSLSSSTVGGIQNHQVTLTYTVYNEQATAETDVLLTTTLAPGVTLTSASAAPNSNGQQLAWSLGRLEAYDRASVTLVVTVPNNVPLQLDSGAAAFAVRDGRAVSDAAPAATLRSGSVDPGLLAATPDADSADPFVQEVAARLDYDPQRIFDFLRQQIGYESYRGSLRGARGTLWSGAGNALDEASLGVALLRASGVPAQYVQGTLSDPLSQQLIVSMFSPVVQVAGFIPPGTSTADPANDPQLLAETRQHYWIEFDAGSGFQDFDPTFAAAQVGQTFAAPAGVFTEVPDALRHKTTVQLDAEITNLATGLFGVPGQTVTTVLTQTFNDVDLVGRPLSIGNFVKTTSLGFVFGATTSTYSPYIAVGDLAALDSSRDELFRGQDYQEVLTNFPFGSQVLTGLFLKVELTAPGGSTSTYERTLVDRIGFAARQGGASGSVAIDPNGPPTLTDFDTFTVNLLPGMQDPRASVRLEAVIQQEQSRLNELLAQGGDANASETATLQKTLITDLTRLQGLRFMEISDQMAARTAELNQVRAYFDQPRLVIALARVKTSDSTDPSTVVFGLDLRRETLRVIAAPGQVPSAVQVFNYLYGLAENSIEQQVVAATRPANEQPLVLNTQNVFAAAVAQDVPRVLLTPSDRASLSSLVDASDEARARIVSALDAGKVVIAPVRPVLLGTLKTTAWYEVDPQSGETIGVTEDGGHSAIVEYAAVLGISAVFISGLVVRVVVGNLPEEDNKFWKSKISDAQAAATGIAAGFGILGGVGVIAGGGLTGGMATLIAAIAGSPALAVAGLVGGIVGVFAGGYATAGLVGAKDPPVGDRLYDLRPDRSTANVAAVSQTVAPVLPSGAVGGSLQTTSLSASGGLSASWSSAAVNQFAVNTLNAPGATVRDANGVVGSGLATLQIPTSELTPVAVAGNLSYQIEGTGSLSFYGPAASNRGVSGDWETYTASLAGPASLTLTVTEPRLAVNGVLLPAGTYTVTAGAATLAGRGANSAPSFAGSVAVNVNNGTVTVGPGTAGLTVGGSTLDASHGVALAGYNGSLAVTAGAAVDTVAFQGAAAQVLRLADGSAPLTADQNTPVSVPFEVQTSLGDSYTLTAEAPEGWLVAIGANGLVTVTPAPGLQGGTIPIRLIARSDSQPALVAQRDVLVTVTPTLPGLTLAVDPDPRFTVPFGGAQVPSAFQATIRNLGPTAETVNLAFPTLPTGFVLRSSVNSLTIPAGESAVVGLYLEPTAALPTPGTQVAFTVTATSASNGAITASETENFVVPEIHGLTLTSDPTSVGTTPGTPVTVAFTVRAVGNVGENVTFNVDAPAGLQATTLGPVVLAAGQAVTQTLTLTPAAGVPLNSTLTAAITAAFGPAGAVSTQLFEIPVRVAVPGADAIAAAAAAAGTLGNADLANRLNDLSVSLTNLVQNPTDAVFKSQALASLDGVIGQLGRDPTLAALTAGLTSARGTLAAAVAAVQVQAAAVALGDALKTLGSTLTNQAQHRFELSLRPNSQVAQPQAPSTFELFLRNLGTETTTYDLSVAGLPAGVTSSLSQTSVTLAPGAFTTSIVATLTPTSTTELAPFSFMVQAVAQGVPEIRGSAAGSLTARREFIAVVSVAANPPFVDPGGVVNVSARVLNAVNREQQALASFVVRNAGGQTVFTSQAVPINLGVLTSLATVDLGSLNTTGFAPGEYTIGVSLTDAGGQPIPGATGEGRLLVGSPVSSSVTVAPNVLPTGTSTVTNTLTIQSTTPLASPLGVVSQTTVPNAAGLLRNGDLLYVGANDGIRIYNISDPANPQLVRTFGVAADLIRMRGDRLYGLKAGGAAGSIVVSIYSIADPANPQLLGATPGIPYNNATDMIVTDTHVFVPIFSFYFFLSNHDVFEQTGDLLSIDVSNPAAPHLDGVLRNTYGTNDDANGNEFGINLTGGDGNLWSGLQVDPTTLLVTGSTAVHSDTQAGSGVVHVVDVGDPAHMAIVRSLTIPGKVQIVGLARDGDRALVIGSTGGWNDFGADLGLTGTIVLAVLDLSDPRTPQILGTQTLTRASRGVGFDAALSNGLFVFSSLGAASDQPELTIVNATDPLHLGTSSTTIPADVARLFGQGNFVYTTSTSGLIIYQLDTAEVIPATAQAQIPKNNGVTVVPGSFSLAPTQVVAGADFDTYVWNLSLGAGTETQTITWRSTVTGMQPGESRPVTLGSTVAFTSGGTLGAVTLPAVEVSANQILGLDPSARTVAPGGSASFNLVASNPTNAAVVYQLAIQGVAPTWSSLPASIAVPAGGTANVPFTLTSEALAAVGDYGFTITATAPTGAVGSVQGRLTLAGSPVAPDPEAHGVVATLIPTQAVAGQGTAANYVVRVTNTGSTRERFNLTVDVPGGIVSRFGRESVEVDPGVDAFQEVALTLRAPVGTTPGSYSVVVRAVASSSSAAATASGSLTVTAFGVAVGLAPQAAAPTGRFEMTVTNRGTTTDTFDLSLGGAGGMVAALDRSAVTLAPGASQMVRITTTGVNFALPGTLDLAAVATSRGDPAVKAGATAALTIAAIQGLDARFDEDAKILNAPGLATFQLIVRNLGNVEDAYEAVVTGSTGPVSARLIDAGGRSTQVVPLFRLPGLSSASLSLQVDLASFGRGTVTVRVRSLSNGSLAAQAVATISAGVVPLPRSATITNLTVDPNPVVAGRTVTLTAAVRPAPGGTVPTGSVTFFDGAEALGTAPLDAHARATLIVPTTDPDSLSARVIALAAGLHSITAVYNGDETHAASVSSPVGLLVNSPQADVGPTVTTLQRFGYHTQPTVLVLTFSTTLDPARAQNLNNYSLVALRGQRPVRRIPLRAVVYDPAASTVVLHPAERLKLRQVYLLTVRGAAPDGLTSATGRFLNSGRSGGGGTDFQGWITRESLAGPTTKAGAIKLKTSASRPAMGRGRLASALVSASAVDALAASGQLSLKSVRTLVHPGQPVVVPPGAHPTAREVKVRLRL